MFAFGATKPLPSAGKISALPYHPPCSPDEDAQTIQEIGAPLQRRACAALIVFLPFNKAHKKRDNYADPWIDACSGRSA